MWLPYFGQVGVHSWCCGEEGQSAHLLSTDDCAHRSQKEYFSAMLGNKNGVGFYFYTLTSAPASGIHWMSPNEIKKWSVAIDFIE